MMTDESKTKRPGIRGGQRIALVLAVIIGGFFLWTEHRAHLLGALPYLILALCPLMHFFMHRGHGGHGHHDPSPKTIDHDKTGGPA